MKKILFFTILLGCLTFISCFKDEPLNAECDVETVWVHVSKVTDVFFQASDTLQTVSSDVTSIIFDVKDNSVDLTSMAPQFKLTAGATITPASGTVMDFSNGKVHTYVVKSQDGNWQRTYKVSFRARAFVDTYSFEHFTLDAKGKYYEWTDIDAQGDSLKNWATANAGFSIARSTAKPEEYPTVPCEGKVGNGVKLETCSTGPFGSMTGKPLAAGNIFIGRFDSKDAMKDHLHSTRFGLPFNQKPLEFTGWYKYLPGAEVKDVKGNVLPGVVDQGTVYAVLYDNHDKDGNAIVLYGDDVQTSENVVAKAVLQTQGTVSEWTNFTIKFEYVKEFDPDKLKAQGYSLTVVGSSSLKGDIFQGAIGSQLFVDELRVVCEPNP
ncbi:MAG: PCMD domain-containing protein [Bacteroidaceae bacterium]|nr:PCMD domain-containing protein [Bacteroidaceae bacterium]